MKILYIVNARIPTEKAHGVQIMKMCEAFSQIQDVETTLAVPKRIGVKKLDPFSYYGISKKFNIKYLPIIDTYKFGYSGFVFGSLTFAISSYIYGLFHKGKVIFYSRDQDQFSFFPFFLGLTPYFFEVHGLKEKGFLHNKLFRKISGVIATNKYIQHMLKYNFPKLGLEDKSIIEPNGVDISKFDVISKFEARKKLSLPIEGKIVLYAGHFYKWKGVDTLVKSAEILPEGVKVYLVGGNKEEIERLKKEIPSGSQKVNFIGHIPFTEVPVWYSASDILVITGTKKNQDSVYYTSPIKLFEYMASKRPIISVDSPAIDGGAKISNEKEFISNKDFYTYSSDDEKDLARVIKEVFAEPHVESKVSSLSRIVRLYTWEKRAERIISFIKSQNEKVQ